MGRKVRRILSAVRGAGLALLFLPFVTLQTIAQGTMPSAGPDGLRMVLCTGGDVVSVVMRADGSIAPAGDDHAGVACPWAIAHAPGVAPEAPHVAVDAPVWRDVAPRNEPAVRIAALALPAPPARGPPLSA